MSENEFRDLMFQFVLTCGELIHKIDVLNSSYILWQQNLGKEDTFYHTIEVMKASLKDLNTLLKLIETFLLKRSNP